MILIDSSFIVSYYNSSDSNHAVAKDIMTRITADEFGPAGLLEYVFLEVVTVLAKRTNDEISTKVGSLLLDSKEVVFIPCTDYFLDTWNTFQLHSKAKLSFVDCALITVAKAHRYEMKDKKDSGSVSALATFDKHLADISPVPVLFQ